MSKIALFDLEGSNKVIALGSSDFTLVNKEVRLLSQIQELIWENVKSKRVDFLFLFPSQSQLSGKLLTQSFERINSLQVKKMIIIILQFNLNFFQKKNGQFGYEMFKISYQGKVNKS